MNYPFRRSAAVAVGSADIFDPGTTPFGADIPNYERAVPTLQEIMAKGKFLRWMSLVGPAFVASVAYVDPGNFATNFQSGSEHGYLLVWVIVMANLMAMLCQYLTAKLGIATGLSLPQICYTQYSRGRNIFLWLESEFIAMATDLAEFTGAAVGLNLVFGIPLFEAGLVTGVISFAILFLEQRGYRPFEVAIIGLLMFVGIGFLYNFVDIGRESASGILGGLAPRLDGGDTGYLMVGIIGATVMPHVIYLHSALHSKRIRPIDDEEAQTINRFSKWDCIGGLGLAGLVNLSMLCIAAALFHSTGHSNIDNLGPIHAHLATMVGGGAALAFGIALIASGLSSSTVGTYAGQIVMEGFMNWRISLFLRRAVTMIPSLIVLGSGINTTAALVVSQVFLSFGIPFALIPTLLNTRKPELMGRLVNRRLTTWVGTFTVAVITCLNLYLLYTIFKSPTAAGL